MTLTGLSHRAQNLINNHAASIIHLKRLLQIRDEIFKEMTIKKCPQLKLSVFLCIVIKMNYFILFSNKLFWVKLKQSWARAL